jgi:hypothetical protein
MVDGAVKVADAAVRVAEFAVARLRLEPTDVLIVKVPDDVTEMAELAAVREIVANTLNRVGQTYGDVLVVPASLQFDVLTAGELHDLLHPVSEDDQGEPD